MEKRFVMYVSGLSFASGWREALRAWDWDADPMSVLISFGIKPQLKEMMTAYEDGRLKPHCFMLDSGAFSAARSGVKISLKEYCAFIKEHAKIFDVVVALDNVIDAKKSLGNVKRMLDYGVSVNKLLPVFHNGDPWDLLDEYMSLGFRYIGCAPRGCAATGKTRTYNSNWFIQKCFHEYHDAGVRFHAFGVADGLKLLRWPFQSADSTRILRWNYSGQWNGMISPTGFKPIHLPLRISYNREKRRYIEACRMELLSMVNSEKAINNKWEHVLIDKQ